MRLPRRAGRPAVSRTRAPAARDGRLPSRPPRRARARQRELASGRLQRRPRRPRRALRRARPAPSRGPARRALAPPVARAPVRGRRRPPLPAPPPGRPTAPWARPPVHVGAPGGRVHRGVSPGEARRRLQLLDQPPLPQHLAGVGRRARGLQRATDLGRDIGRRAAARDGDGRSEHAFEDLALRARRIAEVARVPRDRALLRVAQRAAQPEELVDQRAFAVGDLVQRPCGHGRPAGGPELLGRLVLALAPQLGDEPGARRDELVGRDGVELVERPIEHAVERSVEGGAGWGGSAHGEM